MIYYSYNSVIFISSITEKNSNLRKIVDKFIKVGSKYWYPHHMAKYRMAKYPKYRMAEL